MTDTKHPEALRLVEQYDYGDPVAHSNTWKTAVCNELRRLHAENAWPENYSEDPEFPGFGIWWCPHCGDGKPADSQANA